MIGQPVGRGVNVRDICQEVQPLFREDILLQHFILADDDPSKHPNNAESSSTNCAFLDTP